VRRLTTSQGKKPETKRSFRSFVPLSAACRRSGTPKILDGFERRRVRVGDAPRVTCLHVRPCGDHRHRTVRAARTLVPHDEDDPTVRVDPADHLRQVVLQPRVGRQDEIKRASSGAVHVVAQVGRDERAMRDVAGGDVTGHVRKRLDMARANRVRLARWIARHVVEEDERIVLGSVVFRRAGSADNGTSGRRVDPLLIRTPG